MPFFVNGFVVFGVWCLVFGVWCLVLKIKTMNTKP